MDFRKTLSFGIEQTFTIDNWWNDPGFVSVSDTPLKREKILDLSVELAKILDGEVKQSFDIYNNIQYEVLNPKKEIMFWVTLDPGSIEVKTIPFYIDQVNEYFDILFSAASATNLVPYRNWWYGIKSGTEGGSHINMGGMDLKTNPFYQKPELLLKYIIWIHNHPCIHYPFMGPDVGPEGNSMRMDEQVDHDGQKALSGLQKLVDLYNKKKNISLDMIHEHLGESSLYKEKCSMPSLFKFKEPLYLLEDRAQESLRSSKEVYQVLDLRLKLLKYLDENEIPKILKFGKEIHQEQLTSYYLWPEFKNMMKTLTLDPKPFQIFFERQFPVLTGGGHMSDFIEIRAGRKPRVIKDKKYNNGICVSKTIDTSHKRFEFLVLKRDADIKLQAFWPDGSEMDLDKDKNFYKDLTEDLKDETKNKIKIVAINKKKETIEASFFDIKNMMWD